MGYAIMFGQCYGCGKIFSFNPLRVPSVRDTKSGEKEPVCGNCMVKVNKKRESEGMESFFVPDDAYEPVNEENLW